MSFEFNNAVQKLRPLSNKETRLIIWYLADHASNPDEKGFGTAYASYETLMRRCQIKSRATIINSTTELENLGIIKKVHRQNQCVKYVLSMAAIRLHTEGDICLSPACDGEFYKTLDGLRLCEECYDRITHPTQSDTSRVPHIEDNSNDSNPTFPEVNRESPAEVGSTPDSIPDSTPDSIAESTSHSIPGSTSGAFGSTPGSTLSICIPSGKKFHLEEDPSEDHPVRLASSNSTQQTHKPETLDIAERLRICRHSQLASACEKCFQIEETRRWAEEATS